MTLFDMIVLGAFALAAFFGFLKGGIREMTGVVGFTIALLVAAYALPLTAPLFRRLIHPDWAGALAAMVAVFVVALIGLNLLAEYLAKMVDKTVLGGFDRAIGVGFGLVRTVMMLGLFVLVFNVVVPRSLAPKWVTGSIFYPLATAAARLEASLAPKGFALTDTVTRTIGDKVRTGFSGTGNAMTGASGDRIVNNPGSSDQTPPIGTSPKSLHTPRHSSPGGHSPADRRALDALVEQSR